MKIKTLIIDDHTLFSEGLSLILKGSGAFEVVDEIHDSRQAIHRFRLTQPQLVLVDYNMPHLNGLEVVKELKKLIHGSKIVVLSMYAEKTDVEAFKQASIDGYLTKTTPSDELINALNQIMQGEKIFNTGVVPNSKEASLDTFSLKNKLTNREVEILKEVKKGHSTEQIATNIGLSYYTVETHRRNINKKLQFSNKVELFKFLETL